MKRNLLYTLVFTLLAGLPLQADNWLQNSDFSQGLDHWRGNGRLPSDVTADDPFAKPDPLLSTGAIIPLKERSWTQVTQNFRTKAGQMVMKIVLIFTPGVKFSDKGDDYTNISHALNFDIFQPYNIDVGNFVVQFVDYADQTKGFYYPLATKPGDSKEVTYNLRVNELTPLEDELVTIAFPPGQGNVVLKDVELDGDGGQ